jgi:hypothetical protein
MKTFEEMFELRIGSLPNELKREIIREHKLFPRDHNFAHFPKNCEIPANLKTRLFNKYGAMSKASVYMYLLPNGQQMPELQKKNTIR